MISTIGELKEMLNSYDDNQEVMIGFPSKDYWGTTQAKEITEIGEEKVVWSDYHNTHKLIDYEKEDLYEKDEMKFVVVLS